jgi:hypothetical protein
MFRKRLFVCATALGGVAVLGTLVLVLWPDGPGVTYANFKRVQIGMSHEEVAAAFGVPRSDTAPSGRSWVGLYFL